LTRNQIHQKANEYFRENELKEMSLSWTKKHIKLWLKNPEIFKGRYGNHQQKKIMPFASMQHAKFSNSQVQIDGWPLPFWVENSEAPKGKQKFLRPTVVLVIDNCSKKIIGHKVGFTEDGKTIIAAISNAINNVSILVLLIFR